MSLTAARLTSTRAEATWQRMIGQRPNKKAHLSFLCPTEETSVRLYRYARVVQMNNFCGGKSHEAPPRDDRG